MAEMTFGEMRRKAFQYDELLEQLSELVILSNIPQIDLIKKTGLAHSHFSRKLRVRKFTNNQLFNVFRVIVEESNMLRVHAKKN